MKRGESARTRCIHFDATRVHVYVFFFLFFFCWCLTFSWGSDREFFVCEYGV